MKTVAGVDFASGETTKATNLGHDPNSVYYRRIHLGIDSQDNLDAYVIDLMWAQVWRVSQLGDAALLAGTGANSGAVPAGVFPAFSYPLTWPISVVADASGSTYLLDKRSALYSYVLYKITTEGMSAVATVPYAYSRDDSASLTTDTSGNVYLCDNGGYWGARLVKISPAGVVTTLLDRSDVSPLSVAWHNGLLYFAELGRISSLDSSGVMRTVSDGVGYLLTVGADGTIYTQGKDAIVSIGSDGIPQNIPGMDRLPPNVRAQQLVVDSKGALYLLLNYTVYKVAGGTVTTIAGIPILDLFTAASDAQTDSVAVQTPLLFPRGIAVLAGGDIAFTVGTFRDPGGYFQNGYGIRRISTSGKLSSTVDDWVYDAIAGIGDQVYGIMLWVIQNGILSDEPGYQIVRIEADGSITSTQSSKVYKWDGVSDFAISSSGDFYVAGMSYVEGVGFVWHVWKNGEWIMDIPLGYYNPAVCVDGADNLYVALGSQVLKRTPDGVVTTFAGTGVSGLSGDGGPATSAQLSGVTGLAADQAGNIYIAEMINRRIREVTPDGKIRTMVVTGPAHEPTDGTFNWSSLWYDAPYRIAVDSSGVVYFTEPANALIRKLVPNNPARMVGVSGDGQGALAGTALPKPLIVQVAGSSGIPVQGVPVTWRIITGSATLSAATSETDASGQAQIALTLSNTPGAIVVAAAISGLPPVQFTATGTEAAAQLKLVGGDQQTGATSSVLAGPLVVQVLGASGNPVAGVTVAFAVVSGPATLSATNVQTGTDGTAKVTAALASTAGVAIVSATVAGFPAVQFHLTAVAPPAITSGGVVQAASGQGVLAPGSLATIYGAGFTGITAIYDNFSGMSSANGGYSVGQYAGGPDTYAIGYNFAVPQGGDMVFAGGAYLGSFGSGTNAVFIALRSDLGGKPGAVLESMNLVNVLTKSVTTVGFPSTLGPVLSGGGTYWLTAEMTSPSTSTSVWYTPSPVDQGPAASSLNGGPWTVSTLDRGAFRILASPIAKAGATPLPTNLGNVTVTLAGRTVPLTYVGPTQINFQVPYETQAGSSSVSVTANGFASQSVPVTVAATAPGIFVYGSNWAVAQNEDYSVNGPSNPAKAGNYMTLYWTGGGAVNPAVPTGAAAPNLPLSGTIADVTATINGVPASVAFAGLTPGSVGLLQVNLEVPSMPGGNYPIQLTVGGVKSNTPTVAIVP
jgi:uncharacterized protein (TIGR03437 family)